MCRRLGTEADRQLLESLADFPEEPSLDHMGAGLIRQRHREVARDGQQPRPDAGERILDDRADVLDLDQLAPALSEFEGLSASAQNGLSAAGSVQPFRLDASGGPEA